jgi:hypothetical protein
MTDFKHCFFWTHGVSKSVHKFRGLKSFWLIGYLWTQWRNGVSKKNPLKTLAITGFEEFMDTMARGIRAREGIQKER